MIARTPYLLWRVLVTFAALLAAVFTTRWLWVHYEVAPWTRDGRVRADVVAVAPDVSGFIRQVRVHDNERVEPDAVLFELDPTRYELALRQAKAAAARQRAVLEEAGRTRRRDRELQDVISAETREQSGSRYAQAAAEMAQREAELDLARLNLERTQVKSRVHGVVTNLQLSPGRYLSAGQAALALVDLDSLHVDGYFEETKLRNIRIGDCAAVRIMGEPRELLGRVASIASAIEDRERTPDSNLVANINPTFTWVRLAQRVPVRVVLDEQSPGVQLIAGRTATVLDLDYRRRPQTPSRCRAAALATARD